MSPTQSRILSKCFSKGKRDRMMSGNNGEKDVAVGHTGKSLPEKAFQSTFLLVYHFDTVSLVGTKTAKFRYFDWKVVGTCQNK